MAAIGVRENVSSEIFRRTIILRWLKSSDENVRRFPSSSKDVASALDTLSAFPFIRLILPLMVKVETIISGTIVGPKGKGSTNADL